MLTLIAVIHVLIALGLILFVLLQDPKGGAAGVFGGGGGGSNTLFGATGAGNFLTKTTKWLAIAFAATCLVLTYLTSHTSTSVMDSFTNQPGAAPAESQDQVDPAAPATEAPAESAPATETQPEPTESAE